MEHYDVIVIGAGLAGLRCARLLGERGLRVLLVDRKAELDQAIHTTGIFVRRTLEDFAFPEGCLGPVVRHVRLYSPARRPMDLVSPHDEFRIGRWRLTGAIWLVASTPSPVAACDILCRTYRSEE
jgi:flavin-dependent dehydrogenase